MGSTRRHLITVALLAALCAGIVPAPAWAAPVSNAAIEAKRAQVETVQNRIADLADELEIKVEAYNAVTDQLATTRAAIRAKEAELALANASLAEADSKLSERASSIYRSGPVGIYEVLVGTSSFEDFMTRMDLLAAIGRADADLVTRVRDARFQVESARTALQQRELEQVALRAQADAARDEVKGAMDKQAAYLRSLNGELARLVRAEQERQRRLAEEAARRAREAARLRGNVDVAALVKLKGKAAVVDIAKSFLGVPYEWGATGPKTFDCSGLALYCYRAVGVSLPRTSRQQFRAGAHIPADRTDLLAPGDLVFFGRNGDPNAVHHVGIYVGGGDFIHAPATGDVVKISSLTDRISRRHDYVGASRF